MHRLLLMLANRTEAENARGCLDDATKVIRGRIEGTSLTLRAGLQLTDDPLQMAASATGRSLDAVSALIELYGHDDGTLVGAVEGVAARLEPAFDVASSTAVLGETHQITSGDGDILLAMGCQRLPRLSQAEFNAYWRDVHAPLALSLMPEGAPETFGYYQLHVDTDQAKRVASSAGLGRWDLDGVLLVHCPAPEAFLAVAADPAFALAIYEDEQHFAAQEGMRGAFLKTWKA